MMKISISLGLPVLAALAAFAPAGAAEEVVRHPISFGASMDYGHIVKGRFFDQVGPDSVADGQVISRTGFFVSEGGRYGDLDIRITLGGMYWSVLPEQREEFEKQIVYFGAGIGPSRASYSFGDLETPWAVGTVGFFPIKYNPDSKNLGEYLYRSGTYPGVLYTGGMSFLNSSAYMAQGFRFQLPTFGGKLGHDFTLAMERDMEPIYDFSPGYAIAWKPSPWFELGGGLVWAHGLPVRPDSILTPRNLKNAYDKQTGKPLYYNSTQTGELDKPHYRTGDTAIVTAADARLGTAVPGRDGKFYVTTEGNGVPGERLGYYTYKGFKAMARTSLDLGGLFGMEEAIGAEAFKLYGEWAWLGIEDQPYYYDKPAERMPIMLGVNIPTFKVLDVLGLEIEYRKSRFPNTFRTGFYEQWPLPIDEGDTTNIAQFDPASPGFSEREKEFKKDDLKWSVYAKRTILKGLSVHAQAASDHIRFMTTEGGGKFRPTYMPSTREVGHWYYVLRLEFGI